MSVLRADRFMTGAVGSRQTITAHAVQAAACTGAYPARLCQELGRTLTARRRGERP